MRRVLSENLIALPDSERVFLFLLFYRWIVLSYIVLVAFLGLFSGLSLPWLPYAIGFTFAYNVVLTVFYRRIFKLVNRTMWTVSVDIVVCFVLMVATGGWRSPFYFYLFSPILVGVLANEYRGGILAATQMVPLYNVSIFLNGKFQDILSKGWVETWVANNFSFYLIAIFFAIPSVLLSQLRKSYGVLNDFKDRLAETNTKLARSNKQLLAVQEVNLALQSCTDLREVLTKIVHGLTHDLDFERALIGLVDDDQAVVCDWLGSRAVCASDYLGTEIPLKRDSGPVAEAILSKRAQSARVEPGDKFAAAILGKGSSYEAIPLLAEGTAVGVIVAGRKENGHVSLEEDRKLLESFANQAAIAVRNARLRKESHEALLLRERNRIAMEMHDSVVQILSGSGLILDATIRKLEAGPADIQKKLRDVRLLLKESLENVRYCIFNLRPPDLNDGLVACVRRYTKEFGRINSLLVNVSILGEERPLALEKEKVLYRVLQEALANIVKHADARTVRITLEFIQDGLRLAIEDNGKGFDIAEALSRSTAGHALGLLSMQEAADDFDGNFLIETLVPAGTRISFDLPT